MGPFESFYNGELQHPWLLWAAAIAAMGFCLSRRNLDPIVRRYGIVLTGLSLLDAWLTSSHVYGLGPLGGRAAQFVPLFFVLAGDFRFLLLFGAAGPGGVIAPRAGALVVAAGLTVIVPITSQLVVTLLGSAGEDARVLFFVYELLFVALTLCLLRVHPRAQQLAWLRRVGRFVVLYYSLWAGADAILLATGADWAFGLRVVPNLLYYGGLIAAIGWAASDASADTTPET